MPLAGIVIIAIIQILPLPLLSAKTISSDPYETKIFIMTFATLLVAGEVLFYYTNSERRLKALIALTLLTAAASASFGIFAGDVILDDRFGDLANYFSTDTQGYSQFINRNHFAFLMEMALGLSLGLLLKGRLSKTVNFVCWLLSAMFFYAAITAGSRGGVMSCVALTALAAFAHVMTTRKWQRSPKRSGEGEVSKRPPIWRTKRSLLLRYVV